MQNAFKNFLVKIVVFTAVLAVLEYVFSMSISARFVSSSWPSILLFFLVFTLIMHRALLKSTQDNPKKFIFSFMMFTTIKILLYLAVILVYVLLNRDDAIGFITFFFINYFFFTIFEIISVLKSIQTKQS